jgi:hypothetical protein
MLALSIYLPRKKNHVTPATTPIGFRGEKWMLSAGVTGVFPSLT